MGQGVSATNSRPGIQAELHCKILLFKISGEQSCGSGLLRPPALQFLYIFPLTAQNIEEVDCNGTRTTTTIPAGAIGNEKPISMVRETWYAPAIAAVAESTTEDPRYGKTNHLANVQLSETSRLLFEAPGDFKISVRR